jgi:protein-tyrosine phosphatase
MVWRRLSPLNLGASWDSHQDWLRYDPAESRPADSVFSIIDILIVCTANRCRSPMAEALLRRRLEERRVPALIGSAGFMEAGIPATEDAVATMAEDGYDLDDHRSRIVTADMVIGADLILTMSREHAIELAVMVPDAWPKLFQLTDLVRRAESIASRRRGRALSLWLEEVGKGRTRAELITGSREDDIADPVGQPRQQYDRTKRLLDDLLTKVAISLS